MNYILSCILLYGLVELGIGCSQLKGIVLYSTPYYMLHGSMSNSGVYAMLIATVLPVALYYLLSIKNLLQRKKAIIKNLLFALLLIYFMLACCLLYFSMSRTSWLAAFAGCMTVVYLWRNSKINCKRTIIYSAVLIIALFLFSLFVYELKKDSADGRLLIWKVSMSIVKEHSLLGVGVGNFPGYYGEAQERYFKEEESSEHEELIAGAPEYAYNEHLQILVEHGALGLILWGCLLAFCLYKILHSTHKSMIALGGMFASLLVSAFFSYPFRATPTFLLSILVFLLILFSTNKEEKVTRKILRYAVLVCLFACTCYWEFSKAGTFEYQKIAKRQWGMLQIYFAQGRYEDIVDNYKVLYPYFRGNSEFLFEYGQCLSKTGDYIESNQILSEGAKHSSDPMFFNILGKNFNKMGDFKTAEQMFYKAYYRIPHRFYPLYLLMQLYKRQGRNEEMGKIACQIVEKQVKIDSPDIREMKNEAWNELNSGVRGENYR